MERGVRPLPVVASREGAFLASWPDGGACRLLHDLRCSAHDLRPAPCREFPVHVHLGERLQASLVLSCPGVDLAALSSEIPWEERTAPGGLEVELASVHARLRGPVRRRMAEAERRHRRLVRTLDRQGRWTEEEVVRGRLRSRPPRPTADDFPVPDPPEPEEGLELLPLFFDGRAGPVGLAAGVGGWQLLELRPQGGIARTLATVPPPSRPPALAPAAERLLDGYLRYFLERDLLLASVTQLMAEGTEGTLLEWVEDALREVAATVLSRADVRARFAGADAGPLTEAQLAAGIRATDQDLLDVATWGERL